MVRERGWGVVLPVKGGPDAKSRLEPGLRAHVALAIALDTIAAAIDTVGPERVVVVTADAMSADAASRLGPIHLVPDAGRGLDAAAASGIRALQATGVRAGAVLLADHPCLVPGDLREALAQGAAHRYAVVPDWEGSGTAMLMTTDPAAFVSSFGPGSAARHEALGATRLDLPLESLRVDVDDEESLASAVRIGVGPRTRTALLGYAAERAGHRPHHQ